MSYIVGIDGGGTKTAVAVTKTTLSDAVTTVTGGASWREHGFEAVAERIREAVVSLTGGEIGGIVAGLPCVGESDVGDDKLYKALQRAFPNIPLVVCNDVEVGWAGALALQSGVHLVAGTGSIAYGRDERGSSVRAGGWHEAFSDEGSAFWIAKRAMQVFTKQSDGRLPKGALLDIFREEFGLRRDMDFADYASKHILVNRKTTARLQILCEKAAIAGDLSATEIYVEAAGELCALALAVRNALDFGDCFPVSYSGGVFKAGELVLSPLRKQLASRGGVLHTPKHTPVEGALMLALNMFRE